MSVNKKVLIVTDETESIQLIAKSIMSALTDYTVIIRCGDKFAGTDLLPTDTFFIGCGKPNPVSFTYLTEMLAHINLADRKCGIFSTNEKSIKYLRKILKDCEAGIDELLLTEGGKGHSALIKKWLKGLI